MAALIRRFLSVSCKRLAHAGPLLDSAVAENRTRTARSRLQLSNHSEPLFHWRLCLHISFLPHYHITLYHKRGGVTWLKWAKRPRHAMRQLLQKIINTAAVISRRPILGLLTVNKQCGKIQKSETKRNLMEKWSCLISLQFFFLLSHHFPCSYWFATLLPAPSIFAFCLSLFSSVLNANDSIRRRIVTTLWL